MDFGAKILGQFCDFMLSFHSGSSKEWSKKNYSTLKSWFDFGVKSLDWIFASLLFFSFPPSTSSILRIKTQKLTLISTF